MGTGDNHWQAGSGRMGAVQGFPGVALDEEGEKVDGLPFSSGDLASLRDRLDKFEGEGYERVRTRVTRKQDGTAIDASVDALRGDESRSGNQD